MVERIQRRAVHRIVGVGAETELGDVGLADDDRPGRAKALDEEIVHVRHVVGKDRRAEGGAQALRLRQVLDRHGHPEERAGRSAFYQGQVGIARLAKEFLAVAQRDDRVHVRIDLIDAGEHRLHDVGGRVRAVADRAGQIGRAQAANVVRRRESALAGHGHGLVQRCVLPRAAGLRGRDFRPAGGCRPRPSAFPPSTLRPPSQAQARAGRGLWRPRCWRS